MNSANRTQTDRNRRRAHTQSEREREREKKNQLTAHRFLGNTLKNLRPAADSKSMLMLRCARSTVALQARALAPLVIASRSRRRRRRQKQPSNSSLAACTFFRIRQQRCCCRRRRRHRRCSVTQACAFFQAECHKEEFPLATSAQLTLDLRRSQLACSAVS